MNNTALKGLVLAILLAAASCASTAKDAASNSNTGVSAAAVESGAAQGTTEEDANTAASQIASPESLVGDLYKQHDAKKSPFFQNKSRALVDKYFTKSTADMIWKDATRPDTNEIGALGADPLYDGQDFEIKKFAVGKAEIKDKSAAVPVTFENFGEKKRIVFALALVNNSWKIEDIKYPANYTLTQMYKEDSSANSETKEVKESPTGEFEGKYQVGTTSCTVKPVKMAFEIKWEKGSGTEMFFFRDREGGKTHFASDSDESKANVFSFDDENYNTGTFSRADGKEFPVKRMK